MQSLERTGIISRIAEELDPVTVCETSGHICGSARGTGVFDAFGNPQKRGVNDTSTEKEKEAEENK